MFTKSRWSFKIFIDNNILLFRQLYVGLLKVLRVVERPRRSSGKDESPFSVGKYYESSFNYIELKLHTIYYMIQFLMEVNT